MSTLTPLIKSLMKQGKSLDEAKRLADDIPRLGGTSIEDLGKSTPKQKADDIIDAEYDVTKPSTYSSPSLLGLAGVGALTADQAGLKVEDFKTEEKPKAELEPTPPKVQAQPAIKTKETKTETKPEINIARIILPESAADKELTQQLQSALDKFGKIKDPDVTPGDKRDEMIKDLKALKADKESKLQWAALAERFLSAATKYAAAKRGQDLGLNLSRVEIERTDWDKMIDRAYDNYKTDYADMVKGFEGEDKAKALTDEQRSDMLKKAMNMRGRIAELRDAKAQAQARLDQRYQDMLQRAKEKREDRVLKESIASMRADSKKELAESISEFTDDPATANQLKVAALQGKNQFEKVLESASAGKKLKPDALQNYMKSTWFGLGEDKLDPEAVREQVRKPQKQVARYLTKDGKTFVQYMDGTVEEAK